jgi:hypothetical protein
MLARYLDQPSSNKVSISSCKPEQLANTIRKGDVLLVEGSSRISNTVKYLTQSTWSHSALCVHQPSSGINEIELLEADVQAGVRIVPLAEYWDQHTRICRPIGLSDEKIDALVDYAKSRLGDQYDLKNIIDLARYLIQTPPVPNNWKRRMLAFGSGDPTKAICSSLIAQAFQSVQYPILPQIEKLESSDASCDECYQEILHIRHHSLFAPRDFDISPYFEVVKPSIIDGFNPESLSWANLPGDVT